MSCGYQGYEFGGGYLDSQCIEELKKAALGANLHGWTGFDDALNADGYSEAVSKFIGHCSPSAILALIAQLEAAHKRIAELDNSESQLINERDHAESTINSMFVAVMSEKPEWSNMYQFIDAVDEVEDFVSKLKHSAELAEVALSAANEKLKPISFDELADRVQFVTGGIRMSFDPLNCKGHQIVPFMNFNSLSRIVEMYRTTETYHLAGFTVEGE